MTFKNKNKPLQYLILELVKVHANNQSILMGNPKGELFLFTEAALVLITLERFLRILPQVNTGKGDKLQKLLTNAIKRNILVLKGVTDTKIEIKEINDLRNALLHADYEKAAKMHGIDDLEIYFKTKFKEDVNRLVKFTNALIEQIDTETGERKIF